MNEQRQNETSLLISFVKPHKPVTRDTIARWICTVLKNYGIDTTVYKAHSTRAAATSVAAQRLVPMNTLGPDKIKLAPATGQNVTQKVASDLNFDSDAIAASNMAIQINREQEIQCLWNSLQPSCSTCS